MVEPKKFRDVCLGRCKRGKELPVGGTFNYLKRGIRRSQTFSRTPCAAALKIL